MGLEFKRQYMRTFQLRTMVDIPNLLYMHNGSQHVISTCGHGFTSSLGTAIHNELAWHIRPDDVWLFVLQQATPSLTKTCPQTSVQGLVYEQCVNSLFDQVKCPLKHLYDLDFTTSTYDTKMAAKIALLANKDHNTYPWTQPLTFSSLPPIIVTQGAKHDWDKICSMMNELQPYNNAVLDKLRPVVEEIVAATPKYTSLNALSVHHSGLSSFRVSEGLEIVSGFIGSIFDDANKSIQPNITWYVKRQDDDITCVQRSSSSCLFTYEE